MTVSFVLRAPLNLLVEDDNGNMVYPLGPLLGVDGVLPVKVSVIGESEVTHRSCHAGGTDGGFAATCLALYGGYIPPPEGYTQEQFEAELDLITMGIDGWIYTRTGMIDLGDEARSGKAHHDALLAHDSLQVAVETLTL